ncbi:hypothetical protein Dimus_005969, partial [Dionaea muscipula]
DKNGKTRSKGESLFMLIFVKEFYAKMIVIHLKKKDVVKSKVRGIEMEFDHEKLATILGVPRANGICEYIKEVWEESKYTKPLEITRRFANDENIMAARREVEKIEEGMMMRRLRRKRREGEDEGNRDSSEATPVQLSEKIKNLRESTPRVLRAEMLEFTKFQATFERKRANRFHDDLEKAKAENARLLALLHQAQTKPHP